jgi:hypothetical protein
MILSINDFKYMNHAPEKHKKRGNLSRFPLWEVTPLRLELRTHRLRVCCSTN